MARSWHTCQLGKVALALALALTFAGGASADSLTLSLDTPNTQLNGYPAPYGSVTINRTSTTTAEITFQATATGGYQYIFIDGGFADLNVHVTGTTFTVGAVTESSTFSNVVPSWKQTTINLNGTQVDGMGKFNLVIDNNSAFTQGATKAQFTITNVGGTWSSASDVLVNNAKGEPATAHILAATDNGNGTLTNLSNNTGYAGTTPGTPGGPPHPPVPEPASVIMLGGFFAGLGLYGYRRTHLIFAAA